MSTFKNTKIIYHESLGSYTLDLRHSEFIIGDTTVGGEGFQLILPRVSGGTGKFKLREGTVITIEDPNGNINGLGPLLRTNPNDTTASVGVRINGQNAVNGYRNLKTPYASYTLTYEGNNIWSLAQGGVQGDTGSQGAQGPTGSQGTTGAQGNQGPTGAQGDIGSQGRQGPTGAQGDLGAQGRQGPIGPQGLTGSQGNQGPTGAQGNQGPTGTGVQGAQGAAGSAVALNYAVHQASQLTTGTSGATIISKSFVATGNPIQIIVSGDANPLSAGVWGQLQLYRDSTAIGNVVQYESSAGNENVPYALNFIDVPSPGTYTYSMKVNNMAGGNTQFGESTGAIMTLVELGGALGPQGNQGRQGPTGLQGTTGAQGNQGPTGLQGSTGSQGNQGPTGLQGSTGTQGNQGPTGLQGTTGAQGNQGPTGLQGSTGAQGRQGPSGIDGIAGATGAQGATGASGTNGSNGPQGNQGPAGPQGNQGSTGPQGNQGSTGPQGNQGPTGPQGNQGPTGAQGRQGPTGPQGTNGTDASISAGHLQLIFGYDGGYWSKDTMYVDDTQGFIYANGFYQNSSRTLKTNIVDYTESALDLLNSVNIVSFNYKDNLESRHIGFIAEDTPAELSTKNQNSMDTNSVVGILIKAVQELQAEIKRLKDGQTE